MAWGEVRGSLRHRIGRWAHGVGAATRTDILALHQRLDATADELERTRRELAESQRSELLARDAQLGVLLARAGELEAATGAIAAGGAATAQRLEDLGGLTSLAAWIAHEPLLRRPLISVVLPTRDRPELLARAIASVRAQRYEHWELLVVDDGDRGGPSARPDPSRDARIRWLSTDAAGRGACAARNVALQAARGTLIAYLDDDNMMDRDWLQTVAWAFERHPDHDVLYGAFLIDDVSRLFQGPGGELPRSVMHRWNRAALATGNLSDIGAIAHRAGLTGAWFDEDLITMGDWDLLVRLTVERDPLVLPAIACLYTTDAPDRLSHGPTSVADADTVGRRASAEPAF